MRRAAPVALAIAVIAAAPGPARPDPRPLRHDLRADAAIALGAWGLYGGSELAKSALAPASCRWCDPGALDTWAHGKLVWGHVDQARNASDLLAFSVVPAGMVAWQLLAARGAGDTDAGWVDVLLVAEAAGLAM